MSILRNGKFGQMDRFTIYASNLLPNGRYGPPALAAGEWVIYGGHAHGLTFASQLTNVETIRSERTFGQIIRGLQVYGRAVLDNKAIAKPSSLRLVRKLIPRRYSPPPPGVLLLS